MKLTKIASLALAGVMALSMLAGCSNKETTPNNPTDVTTNSSVVSVVNAAIKGNDANVSFGSNADFTKSLKEAIATKGAATAADIQDALEADLEAGTDSFTAAKLNPSSGLTDGTKVKGVQVYVYSGKNETSLSAAYQASAEINKVVEALKSEIAESNKIFDFNYSNAYVEMVEVNTGDTNYYVVAVSLTCEQVKL